MLVQKKEMIERHIKTHSERSAEDCAAVATLEYFLQSEGRINTNFAKNDKWPNTDGTFEFVLEPESSRRPKQNFFVQIKGTHDYKETAGVIKYSLKSLAFPAFIYSEVTLDPGILFVVLDPDKKGKERVFWKYMSVDFISSINYEHESVTVSFSSDEELKNTYDSISAFCESLAHIISHHSFVKQLSKREYNCEDLIKIISASSGFIAENIERMDILNDTRDNVSKRILTHLYDLCFSTLILNTLNDGFKQASMQLAWERSFLSIKTKYLGSFLRGLKYLDNRIPDDGQSERLMLKYYDFLWQIRKFLHDNYRLEILPNLENFPLHVDELDSQYYELVAASIDSTDLEPATLSPSRFYVQKRTPFFVGKKRYYEITLQLAGPYATKYNRITAYTKENISTSYSIQVAFTNANITLWDVPAKIRVITNWKVSVEPSCLNMIGKILRVPLRLNSKYGEYVALMNFLTKTGMSLLDLIDLQEVKFMDVVDSIYNATNTAHFKAILLTLRNCCSSTSKLSGRNTVRYLLQDLHEETMRRVLPFQASSKQLKSELYLSSTCLPFEINPFISNLAGSRTSGGSTMRHLLKAAGTEKLRTVLPYLTLKTATDRTGEIYFKVGSLVNQAEIVGYNAHLDGWERKNGFCLNSKDGFVCIDSYERSTIEILQKLLVLSHNGNKGQKEYNESFIQQSKIDFSDKLKMKALKDIFVSSKVLLIYGAAGTGKTTLINYISNLMSGRRKLFLTKTHTALQNLQRRIDNPGDSSDFISIDSFTRTVSLPDYDIIFVDECSTIDNRTMQRFLQKLAPNTFLVLAGDIYQIESIDFGNWFFYAKDIISAPGSNVELLSTWRTKDEDIINLWDEVRTKDALITEKLVIDGPFSEDIGPDIFRKVCEDEVILCLNYDGKFGLNNMNNYFQNANLHGEAVSWREWSYKVGDPILFNETKRFPQLYNNLKGRIVDIEKTEESISFTVDVDRLLTEMHCQGSDLEFIEITGPSTTRIRFTMFAYDEGTAEEDEKENLRMMSVVPFQLAYAVSIHKAQGLEYDSVKVIIPTNNSERITHGIFYTAITRAKKSLKIYWSAETMKEIVSSFSSNPSESVSLDIVKSQLCYN